MVLALGRTVLAGVDKCIAKGFLPRIDRELFLPCAQSKVSDSSQICDTGLYADLSLSRVVYVMGFRQKKRNGIEVKRDFTGPGGS